MKIIDVPQGSLEWRLKRAGRVTASNVAKVLSRARDRKSEGATRANYKARIVAEILTGLPQEDDYTNDDMEGGEENEPFGAAAYEIAKGLFTDKVGIVVHPRMERFSCSPDRLVGEDGMVQIKCPKPANHLAYRFAGVVPPKYEPQLVSEMAVCERAWSDFVSYCPAFPSPINLFVVRLQRSVPREQAVLAEITQFNREVDEIIEKLTGKPVDEYLERLGMKATVL